MSKLLTRRGVMKTVGAGTATGLLMPLMGGRPAWAQGANLSVFGPLPPDPAPPGAAEFAISQFDAWKSANGADVSYDLVAWPQLHDRMATAFASGSVPWDVIYMCGWVPEFQKSLLPLDLPQELIDDLPPSIFETVKWDGKNYGVVFTLSLLTLFYNKEHLDQAGLGTPPATWDDFLRYTKELTRDGRYGYVCNYGRPSGIGGAASYWMAFLQQAGGTMYGEDGMPVFAGEQGVAALQMMLDLMEAGTDPGSISYEGINASSNVLMSGQASMMMNWPFMWNAAQDEEQSTIAGKLGAAVLPAGPAGSASIDGTDAWTISAASANPEAAKKLIEFYMSPEIQKRQAIDTGWLPSRMSVMQDPEVQEKLPFAQVLLEQAKHPFNSYVTPDYTEVTQAIGVEIQRALQGQKTAAAALTEASEQVTAIVRRRG